MLKLLGAFAFGSRSLRQKPAYYVVSVALLAFTAAALTVMAALIEALVLRPPTAHAPEELVFVNSTGPRGLVSRPAYLAFRERNRGFAELIAYNENSRVRLRVGERDTNRFVQAVSGNYFSGLGVPMLRGRGFVDGDDRQAAPNVAVITEELSRDLGVDVGGTLELNTRHVTVIGVLAAGYEPIDRVARPDLFIPTGRVALYREEWLPWSPDVVWLRLVGRLRPNVSPSDALADLQVVSHQVDREASEPVETHFVFQSLLPSRIDNDARARTALLLGGAVMFLFVLACANQYGLTRVRWLGRRREVALRLALGATPAHIAAWRLGELCGVLVLGGVIGIALGKDILARLSNTTDLGNLFTSHGVHLSPGAVLGVAATCAVAVGVVWLLGIDRLEEHDLQTAIKETTSAPRQRRGLVALLAVELGIALGLVALSFAFLGTLSSAFVRRPPIQLDGVYFASAEVRELPWFNDRERANAFYQSVLDQLEALDGVKAAGLSAYLPLNGSNYTTITLDGNAFGPDGRPNFSNWVFVSPGFFEAYGIRFQSGRNMSADEVARHAYVAVVNRAFVRRYFPGEGDAIGKLFEPFDVAGPTPIVGVVDDIRTRIEDEVQPQFFLSYTTTTLSWAYFHVQLEHDTPEEWQAASNLLAQVWPNDTPPRLSPASGLVMRSVQDLMTALQVAGWVALLALLVVACGVYFLSAFLTAQSLRDSAVRIALGASFWQLAREHVKSYRSGLLGGLGLGTLLVLGLEPMLEALQLTLRPPGVVSVLGSSIVLGAIALFGLCAPLWRLRRLDVVSTLSAD
jgi:putative ABC transport system permease protein